MSADSTAETSAAATQHFVVRDCALIALATGREAYTLKEMRDELLAVAPDSIYHHFWGGLLEPRFEEREYYNDFAAWARHALHNFALAERLAVIDPTRFKTLEALREEIVDIVEQSMEENDYVPWQRAMQRFEFIRSQIVVFDTGRRLTQPSELIDALPLCSTSSIFYHFIDARRRQPDGQDDFSLWLSGFDTAYAELRAALAAIDPYFATLSDLRARLADEFRAHLKG